MSTELVGFCRFCIALCGIRVSVDDDRVVSVKGDPSHPLSRGYTCAKGRSLGRWHHHPDRILSPKVRSASTWTDVPWVTALDDAAAVIRRCIADHGPDSVGVYIGTAASLDGAGKWAAERFVAGIGSRSKYSAISIDTPCKPLVSTLMSGHTGLVPVVDHERCTMTVFVGSNPVVSHGHLNGFPDPIVRLRDMATAPRELWVIDSRKTESSRLATRSLMPRPGTDFAILAFLVKELLVNGGCDAEYLADHVDAADLRVLRDVVRQWDVTLASEVTGCSTGDLTDLLAAVRRHRRVAFQTGTGATMAPAANLTEWLVWVLQIVTGSYDRPGGMWFNPGYLRRIDTDVASCRAASSPGPGPKSRPDLVTWGDEYPCSAMADEIESGNLRALVVFGGNPLTAFPNVGRVTSALEKLDALIVLDVIDTQTTAMATHVLPTKGQLERPDLPYYYDQFNLDFSTQYSPPFVPPRGESRSMWLIAAQLAKEVGVDILPAPLTTESSDDEVLATFVARSGSSFDQIKDDRYVAHEPVFGWVTDRVLPDRRWRVAPHEFVAQMSKWTDLVPPPGLVVTSRRQHRHLNSQQPTGVSSDSDHSVAFIHPDSANHLGIGDGDFVEVVSANGSIRTRASINSDVHPDVVSVTHGLDDANVCELTTDDAVDELTGMVVQTALPVVVRSAPRQF